jgi:hypothetical protein
MIAMEINFSSRVCLRASLCNSWIVLTKMIGIAYQLTEDDPLIDTNQCTQDAALMKTLGTNAIRVYHVDPTGDHSGCMAAFAAAGIYLFVDLDTFTTQIDPVGLGISEFLYQLLTSL